MEAAGDDQVGVVGDAKPEELPLEYIELNCEVDPGMSEETVKKALEFKAQPTDIMISTFPKTGTTLLQWMCHQIRTGGHTDFEDIYQVSPWIMLGHELDMDPDEYGSRFSPRIFKSHARLASEFRGCKYLVPIRDPTKVTISFYNFLKSKGIPEEVLGTDVSDFLLNKKFVKGEGKRVSIWDFYKEYYQCRDCSAMQVVVYEDLVRDMPSSIKIIADFMNIAPKPELVDTVAKMCTKDYMSEHMSKMDESWVHARVVKLDRSESSKAMWSPAIRIVKDGHKDVLSEEALKFLNEMWEKEMSPLGFPDYAAFAKYFTDKNAKKLEIIESKQ
mmetsp:Transcript_12664/g.23503  ORF Transcript_12664/g.23503 Transcript_12664/m.23503 type:complete len:330 (+) Transcript_12664:44-1033(+)